jgi:hypothetical protein
MACRTCDMIRGLLMSQGMPSPVVDAAVAAVANVEPIVEKKVKRKVGKYQKEFGRQLRLLKAKHPRTPTSKLMKRAHSITRRSMR